MSGCDWAFAFDEMKTYHDTEWGVPVHDDRVMFEHLMMEVMQCGLSWALMIKKRASFRAWTAVHSKNIPGHLTIREKAG